MQQQTIHGIEHHEPDEQELGTATVLTSMEASSPRDGLLWMLWDHRKFLQACVIRTMVLGALVMLLIPNYYESTTRIVAPDNASGNAMLTAMLSRAVGALPMAGNLLGFKSSDEYLIAILKSRTVQERVISRFELQKVYRIRTLKETRKKLESLTEIKEDRKSSVITITVTDRSRERARDIARAYVDELNRLAADLNTSAAHRERVFIEERLKTVKAELDTASKEFSEFSSKNTAIDIKEQGRAMVEAAATLQGQLIAAQSELEAVQQTYTENNIRVRSLKARIAELQRQLAKLGGAPAQIDNSGNELYPSIRQLPLLGVTWADLYRRVRVQETVFELLTQQYELAKVEEAKQLATVAVLDPPDLPERKAGPARTLSTLLCGIAAFVLGSAWLLIRNRWSQIGPEDDRKLFLGELRESSDATLAKMPRLQTFLRKLRKPL